MMRSSFARRRLQILLRVIDFDIGAVAAAPVLFLRLVRAIIVPCYAGRVQDHCIEGERRECLSEMPTLLRCPAHTRVLVQVMRRFIGRLYIVRCDYADVMRQS